MKSKSKRLIPNKEQTFDTIMAILTSLSVIRVFLSMVACLTSSLFSLSRSLTLVQESLKKIISLPIVRFSFSRVEIRWLLSSNLESRISACCLSRLFSFSRSFLSFSSWELSCSRVLFWTDGEKMGLLPKCLVNTCLAKSKQ